MNSCSFTDFSDRFSQGCSNGTIYVRSTSATPSGKLIFSSSIGSKPQLINFSIKERPADPKLRTEFYLAKKTYYDSLITQQLPGVPWFRSQRTEASIQAGEVRGAAQTEENLINAQRMPQRVDALEDTYQILNGSRALSENLQLDRGLRLSSSSSDTVDLKSIEGLTTPPFDWKKRIANIKPELDSLAVFIPEDQYAIFFPSITAMINLMDEAEKTGSPILSLVEERSEDAAVRERYQKQLCLPLSDLTRVIGPLLVRSVAMTGSDPYFRTGTDLTLLMESTQKDGLLDFISQRQTAAKLENPGSSEIKETFSGVQYSGVVSPDRRISSYVAAIGEVILVSNSKVGLERIISASQGKIPQLKAADEYTFFRDRYKKTDTGETALVVLSDATIRKWSGPEWRIGSSRRTRAAAMMAGLQAKYLSYLVSPAGKSPPNVTTDESAPGLGQVRIDENGIRTALYGTPEFLTPISELNLQKVSKEEAEAYGRFKTTYQSYWKGYFDPIAVRLSVSPASKSADVTVMPLIAGTDYASVRELTQGVALDEFSGDVHPETLIGLTLAINSASTWVKSTDSWTAMLVPGVKSPFSWIGKSISIFLDDGPFWKQVEGAEKKEKFLEEHYFEVPFGLFVEVQDSLKLTAFLTAMRGFAEQSAPGMARWENLKHGESTYVKISQAAPSAGAVRQRTTPPWAVYYAVTSKVFLLSLREDLLLRAMDRVNHRADQKSKADRSFAVGSNLLLELQNKFIRQIQPLTGERYREVVRRQCFSNIPILNEWKKLFPERDPVEVHRAVWKSTLNCAGGGGYTWNEEWGTMESAKFGHAGQPKEVDVEYPLLDVMSSGKFALQFEEDGVRAKALMVSEQRAR